ncbi:MAG: sugar-binding transcriptional regulator [Verrucomicrobiaceae bacterium]|nr:MAG: sugar-binding transcriptional regulator [Verrucomicrobiaceae bacterium]
MNSPRAPRYTDEQLRLAARLYYVDGLGQAEVAQFTRISQAKVSRLLALARERGIVKISVAEYEPRSLLLEDKLRSLLGLGKVAVIRTLPGATSGDARRAVGHFGASIAASLIAPGNVVAISGGRTMRELVRNLPTDKKAGLTVVQTMGSIDSSVAPVDALELGRVMARRCDGLFQSLNSPAFVPDKQTRDAFLNLTQIRSVWQQLNRASVAMVGVGTLENSIFVERGILSPDELAQLRAGGAVGEICGRFFNAEGQECDTPWRDRVVSIELEQLRTIPQVIGIVAGSDRSRAIAAAVRGGLLKSLIIDEGGANALPFPSFAGGHSAAPAFSNPKSRSGSVTPAALS